MCRCTCWSCAGTVLGQLHMLYEHTFQVFRGICTTVSLLHIFVFIFVSLLCAIWFFFFFFFLSLQCMILLRVFRVVVWTIDDVLSIIFFMTVSVTMNSGFALNMTGFVLKITVCVFIITRFLQNVLNMTGFFLNVTVLS